MAELKAFKPEVTLSATFTLNEEEIAALDAIAEYGIEAFLTVFYKEMGSAYLGPHEAGLRRVFGAIRETAGPALRAARAARITLDAAEVGL